jgi:hypothetical protein
MNDSERIDEMVRLLKNLKKNCQQLNKLSSVEMTDCTQRRWEKNRADVDWLGMDNIKLKHELHALCVELFIADRRESYEEIYLGNGWQNYKYKPREPWK